MALDYTVKIFDQFYNLDLVVDANEYEIVYSFFKEYSSDDDVAKSFTETLFRIANETQISVLDLLNTFKTTDKMKVSLTMAYYLNSLSNKTVLYGVNQVLVPNNLVQRNIIYDGLLTTPLVANFNRTPTSGCAPLTVTFTDTSTGTINSWFWDFGDSTTSTLQNPTHIYTVSNTYTVLLTVTGPSGTDSISKSVSVSDAPVASFTRTPSSGCAPLTVNFTDTSTGTITGWLWNFGDGNTSTSQNPSHTYTLENVYTVSLTVTNGCGSDSSNSSVTVTAVPVASFTANPTSGEAPLTVTFTDTSTGTITGWLWNFGDGNTSTLQNPTHTYSTDGEYTVTLTVSNTCGSDTANENISVSVACDPYFGYVALLLHFDGTNGSTTFIDSSSYASPITVSAGSPMLSTSIKKFGTASLRGASNGSAVYINAPIAPSSGTGSWTFETWVNRSVDQNYFGLYSQGNGTFNILIRSPSNGGNYSVMIDDNGTNFLSSNVTVPLNIWMHIAVTYESITPAIGTWRIFQDGILTASINRSPVNIGGSTNVIGRTDQSGFSGLNGYLDEYRLTIGVARYVSNFTPQTAEFPDISCADFSIPSGILVPATVTGFPTFELPAPAVVPATVSGLDIFEVPSPISLPITISSP